MTRARAAATALILATAWLTSFGAGVEPAPAAPAAVSIDNFTFGPAELTIAPGTTVTWTNRDDIPHTVVDVDKTFKSSVLDTDETYEHTFVDPGTYRYFCSLHPKMTGRVVVR
jgi:plastocyanin